MSTCTTEVPSYDEIAALDCFDKFTGIGGIELTVVHRHDVAEDGSTCGAVLGTSDGRHADVETMHTGPQASSTETCPQCHGRRNIKMQGTGDRIPCGRCNGEGEITRFEKAYFELHRRDGADTHGWVDGESRRVVQVG